MTDSPIWQAALPKSMVGDAIGAVRYALNGAALPRIHGNINVECREFAELYLVAIRRKEDAPATD